MKYKPILIRISVFFIFILTFSCQLESQLRWPEITFQSKPWTRWWWMGNAVNEQGLTYSLEEYAKAGFGGVEITPIYGVKGFEEEYIEYLSPEWTDMLMFTLREAERLNLGVDMATGSGWPFGGPWIRSGEACKYMVHKVYVISGGKSLTEPIQYIQSPINRTIGKKVVLSDLKRPVSANDSLQQIAFEQIRFEEKLPLVVLMAYSEEGEIIDLTSRVDEGGMLDWTAPEGHWKLLAVFQGLHGKLVERAAPGGEGDIIDHFSKEALQHYLNRFDQAFKDKDISSLRGFFNDSYEVDDARGEADFTPRLFDEFEKRRGYDLREYLPALYGIDTPDKEHVRILHDYRQTISELLLQNFTLSWNAWAEGKGAIVRNQAHGSPANILDLYAGVDIPETEGEDLLRIKFASSAGNIVGKKLVSCEAATWVDEHFLSSLADVKTNVDRFFLGGVNHIVYHGTTYSPKHSEWPGWMFYASVHFAPTNSFWKDLPALNSYVARCQSLLQEGKPDNDILLYYPFHDRISVPGTSLLQHFSGKGPGNSQTEFRALASVLINLGYSLDYISDAQIMQLRNKGSGLASESGTYKTVLVPSCRYMPLETFQKLMELAEQGATLLFHKNLPGDIAGYAGYEEKKKRYNKMVNDLHFTGSDTALIRKAQSGKGSILIGPEANQMLTETGAEREKMVDLGMEYLRRATEDGTTYFITNRSNKRYEGYIPLNHPGESVAIFNPNTGFIGLAQIRHSGSGDEQVYIQLAPGETCFLKTYNKHISGDIYPYYEKSGSETVIEGPWELRFISGGPTLFDTQQLTEPVPWTDLEGEEYHSFSGTARYTCSFQKPTGNNTAWLLNLGDVYESATVFLNGEKIATLFSHPYQILIKADQLTGGANTIEIDVSNLMVNRIIYMERNNLEYRNFYNVNFPAKNAGNRGKNGLFTSKNWEPVSSGLQEPVTLTPVRELKF